MPLSKAQIKSFEALEVNRFILRSENLITIAIFTLIFSYVGRILYTMGPAALAMSIMLIYISNLLFLGYLFVITEQSAYGHQRIPPMSAQILEQEKARIFKLTILVSMFFSCGYLIVSPVVQILFVLTSLILFPISISVLILTASLTAAINPLRWLAAIRALQMDARLANFLCWQLATIGLIYLLLTRDMGWTNILVTLAFVASAITMFRSLGVVLHSNSDTLGFDVMYSQDISESEQARGHDKALSAVSDTIYRLHNTGEKTKAESVYEQQLKSDDYRSEALLFDRFRKWESPGFAITAGRGYIDRLISSGKNDQAWEILLFCFTANQKQYRLITPESVLTLSKGTLSLQQKTVIAHLFAHFADDFPKHPAGANCLVQAVEYYAQDLADPKSAKHLLAQYQKQFPEGATNPVYLALKDILDN